MTRGRTAANLAAITVTAVILSACGGGDKSADDDGSSPTATATSSGGVGEFEPTAVAALNAGIDQIFNPSKEKGGTLRMANAGDWDSLDPADTYFAYSWNFVRLYGRSLVVFKAAAGTDSATLVPDLAEELGKPSDGAKTWTYKLRAGVKFEDGTEVTSKDVKYAVERSLDKKTFPNGPTYFNDFLDLDGYTSPYDDTTPDKLGLKAIETPDDRTIVFKLKQPFSGFDYFAQLPSTIPVPQKKDTGTKYKDHVISSGPYKFDTNNPGKNFTLVRNEHWDAASDPIRTALPDRIEVALNVNADDIDNRLISGDLDLDVVGAGVQAAAQGRILNDKKLKQNADIAQVSRTWFSVLNPTVPPFDNIHCRKAVEFAADKRALQNAYGGATGGGIATGLLPPSIPGFEKFDLYKTGEKVKGDLTKARDELKECGKPDGFSTNVSYRIERPKERATAEALQQALDRVGIKLTLKSYPQADYAKLYAGKPDYVTANNLGIIVYGWGADWPDGFGFLQQIVDSRAIRATGGNTNLGIDIPEVNDLLDDALKQLDTAKREVIWSEIDRKVMEEAQVLPGVWAKGLFYRPENLTNVFISNGYQMYDYVTLGVKKK